ncbi:MAG TPA: hypothetical protein VGQ20_16745 [Acidimicrobiales bacterium]|jgi:hypothetical protein|nr:hypothetical protein [Acidimicrobiales bacterium]
MAFGQSTGIPATAKQVQYLLALVQKAGHAGFRDARGPLGLTQRQASGKFTRTEASTLIDQLMSADESDDPPDGTQMSAADRLELERAEILRGMPAGLLAAELERRGWTATAP